MHQNSDIINDFESLLLTRSTKKPLALYTNTEHQNKSLNTSQTGKTYSAKEVLTNVSKQLKAIQNADTASYKRVGNKLDKYKKREFLPVDMIAVCKEVPKNIPTKFETQCATDTQLINIIENAEIVDRHRGVTQEFDETFCQKSDDDDCDNNLNDVRRLDTMADVVIDKKEDIMHIDTKQNLNDGNELDDQDSKPFENSDFNTCEKDTVTFCENDIIKDFNDEVKVSTSQVTQGFHKSVMILDESEVEAERSVSPVLNTNKRNSTPPLVVSLYSFEEFENVAHPIIEAQEDLETAKSLINSQIIGREISIPDHIYESLHRESPILNKIECITTNIKNYFQDINLCSDKCISRDSSCNQSDLSSGNKKMQSKIIKSEIKDEILFSSDEEYEYLHKEVQELPLTCALETSFYDRSDVLDRTMYVGFQTASNKSIQINTDSFMKAKRILTGIDHEETETTLKELVEIFDTGKAENENVQSIEFTSWKQEYDSENKSLSKVKPVNNEDLASTSERCIEFEDKIGDTFKYIGLTALEQEENVNEEIEMSQILKFKSTPKAAKVNNSNIFVEKLNDTPKNSFNEDEQMDDNIVMSQVIEFKSISRTPILVDNICNTSASGVFKNPNELITKRKFEGFKTASNKKIKLSDKTLARCKKVFHDIDLNETEDLNCQSDLSYCDLKTNPKIKTNASKRDNDISDNLTILSVLDSANTVAEINDTQSETDLKFKENQPDIEDMDFQINDKIILQEFEHNEMSFEKTNNNVYVGFKTASYKNIIISDAAIAKTKHLFQEIINVDAENDDFTKTDNINQCKNIFKKPEIDLKEVTVKQSEKEEFAKVKRSQNDIPLAENRNNLKMDEVFKRLTGNFDGFKTAANKEIQISELARKRTKDFFKDLDTNLKDHKINMCNEEKTYSNTEKKIASHVEDEFNCGIDTQDFLEEEMTHIENFYKDNIVKNENPLRPAFQGFQTASSKPVVISKKAKILENKLRHDKKNIHVVETDLLNIEDFSKEQKTFVAGYETVVGKTVQISELSLKDDEQLFSTSGSKKISKDDPIISESAIVKTKSIRNEFKLKDDDNMVDNNYGQTIDPKPSSSTFVGFQTASNKKIQISADALAKSKQMLNDFEFKDDFSEVENNMSAKNLTNLSNNIISKGNIITDNHITPSTSKFIGFQTASNKEVKISNKALTRSTMISQEVNISEKENDVFDEDMFEPEENASPVFKGFQTGSNKKVSNSEKALEKNKKLFQDIDTDDCLQNENREGVPVFKGFQTASDKKVDISEKALAKSKQQIEGINLSQFGKDPKTDNLKDALVFRGFQTASNKKVEISEKALAKSKQIFEDIHLSQLHKDPNTNNLEGAPVFRGFQTASNKKVAISEKALAKSKELFEDINLSQLHKDLNTNNLESEPVFRGFQTASNKKVAISEKALAKSKELFEDINLSQLHKDPNTNNLESAPVFRGFQTASNKKVTISEKALAKSKELFEDINLSQLHKDPNTNNLESEPVFRGFQTASNKKVAISEKALAKSKELFEDINLSQLHKDPNTNNLESAPVFRGFQTASNKKVEISEKALAKSKEPFEDINLSQLHKDPNTNNLESEPVFRGFQTASNKKVAISEKALAKSKELFEDINLSQLHKDPNTNNLESAPVFRGFQTASNKKVEISEKALAKSKEPFEDINLSQLHRDPNTNNHEGTLAFRGFQTASNKTMQISEQALAKSRQLFEDINFSQLEKNKRMNSDLTDAVKVNNDAVHDMREPLVNENAFEGFHTDSNKKANVSEEDLSKGKNILKERHVEKGNGIKKPESKVKDYSKVAPAESKTEIANVFVKDVIDTQVFNDFQDTLNTEDFCKSTQKSKRSGSPILSCPRAKKRKFETPYRSKKKIEPKNAFVPPKVSKTFNFNQDYKKHKKYNLQDLDKLERGHTENEIDPYITEFRFDTLQNFEFGNSRNDYTEAKITIEDLKKIFLDSVNKKIVPDGWLDNHIKLILWKLLSYEVKYPNMMKNSCTVRNVLEQLKYRYDRELYNVQRPVLRKVLEKDEVASKTMVLCVAAIYVDNISVTSVSPTSQNVELLLTDGWYCVKACTDRMLVRLAAKGSIVVGTKIAVSGAELLNCEQGIAPWEDTSSVRLKLSGNSVLRARWPARLGVRSAVDRRPLRAVCADGGKVAAVRVLVTRVYPPLYVEKMDDGSTVTLSERLENIRQAKYESERQAVMEKLYEEVEKEMSDQDSQDSEGSLNERNCLESGSQISKCMKRSKDPDEYRSHLTKSQHRMLEEHNSKQRERLIERVRTKFQQKLEKNGLKTDRNVAPLLKVRIAGFAEKDGVEVTKGYLSIWRPSAAVLELVTEGAWIEVLNVIPTGIRNSEVQLSAGRQTVFDPYKQTNEKFKVYANTLKRKCYEIRDITQNSTITTDYNEIDTVGMIFCIEPSTKEFNEKQNFQNVYLADADKNIICVNFWGGLKKFGFENVLDTGQIVTCVNLQKRAGNTRKSIPEYRVTEFSYFTKTPKNEKALEITNELSNKLSKIKDRFCEDCVVLKSNYYVFKTRNNENISPYNNNISKMVSPLRNDANLNLTGLDFDSSFDTQDITPQSLSRKKKVNEKIEKLRLSYGEPPPLSSIHIINKSKNASATYKSPLILNSERLKVASVQNPLGDSPVLMNRTYVKNINPVKLNFSNASLGDNIDHFAEDFDASPPLSLDSDTLN